MKTWFAKSKKAQEATSAKPALKELSDDLLAQISGGAGKGACHTGKLV